MASPATKTTKIPPFTLSSPLGTDIWRKPPSIDVFSAPTHPSPLPNYPLPSFQRARLTVSLPPVHTLRQFDQAGLILHFASPIAQPGSRKDKWIKTGIEFFNGKPYLGTAGADKWSDWSVVPIYVEGRESRVEVTVEVHRERDELGKSLWVYQVDEEGERVPLRERNLGMD
ncbi:hypothetical protein IQ07DRAFT_421144 [Pyrenochaeta sp. DS3sAY3a]|nr:hypothetical protein IQ07DRAFT_421144 [Pyrenochaeta sp. DS3sAY3a]